MPIDESELNNLAEEALKLLTTIIGIPAYSKEEDRRADFLEQYLQSRSYHALRIGNNVLSGKPDPTRPIILLNSHLDTVKPASTWTKQPHTPIISDGKLYGLGSNDAGASLVSLLMAYLHLTKQDTPYQLIYAATAEEEISGQNGIIKVIDHLGPVHLAIVGEPTGMNLAVAEKGLMVIDATSEGVSGHAARDEGKNAIYQALDDINNIRNFRFEKISEHLGSTKATVTIIQAGSQHNVIPDTCTFVIDIRSNELYDNQEIHQLLQSQVQSNLTARSYRLKSSHISMQHPIVQKGLSMGLTAYGSPTLSDQALMPYTSIKIGPGQSSRSHTADEYITIEELRHGIQTYITLLTGLHL